MIRELFASFNSWVRLYEAGEVPDAGRRYALKIGA